MKTTAEWLALVKADFHAWRDLWWRGLNHEQKQYSLVIAVQLLRYSESDRSIAATPTLIRETGNNEVDNSGKGVGPHIFFFNFIHFIWPHTEHIPYSHPMWWYTELHLGSTRVSPAVWISSLWFLSGLIGIFSSRLSRLLKFTLTTFFGVRSTMYHVTQLYYWQNYT